MIIIVEFSSDKIYIPRINQMQNINKKLSSAVNRYATRLHILFFSIKIKKNEKKKNTLTLAIFLT